VSCPKKTLCIAVGARQTAHGAAPLAEEWNGHHWTGMSVPAPHAREASLAGVSCPTSKDCTAVGQEGSSATRRLAEQWNGKKWRITQASDPRGVTQGSLAAVSCTRPGYCVAVGTNQKTSSEAALSERWNGSSWKALKAAAHSGSVVLAAVNCTSTFCMAVGQGGAPLNVLAEKLTGSTWTAESVPAPAGSNFSALYGVWCSSQDLCRAAGQVQGTVNGAIAYVYNGGWGRQSLSGKHQILNGISCTAPSRCMAVGSGPTRPVSQRWHGSWTSAGTAHISGTPFAGLAAVSCPSSARCIAVGSRSSGSPAGFGTTLAEEWTGAKWHLQSTPNP
jgi:hypothetical protein